MWLQLLIKQLSIREWAHLFRFQTYFSLEHWYFQLQTLIKFVLSDYYAQSLLVCIIFLVFLACVAEYAIVARRVKQLFHEYNIHCTTIQPEFEDVSGFVFQ